MFLTISFGSTFVSISSGFIKYAWSINLLKTVWNLLFPAYLIIIISNFTFFIFKMTMLQAFAVIYSGTTAMFEGNMKDFNLLNHDTYGISFFWMAIVYPLAEVCGMYGPIITLVFGRLTKRYLYILSHLRIFNFSNWLQEDNLHVLQLSNTLCPLDHHIIAIGGFHNGSRIEAKKSQ